MATIDVGLDRGRAASGPTEMPAEGWKDILWRIWTEFFADRIQLIAAGASFFLLLALFPALAAFVALYGFVADPRTVADHVAFLGGVLPTGGYELIRAQLQALANQDETALSFAFVFGLLFAIWSANSGIKTLFDALNVAYDEVEKRSFVRLTLISLLFTLGAIVVGILMIVCVGVVPAILAVVGLGGMEEALISILRWPLLILTSAAAISILYRYGPSRERAKWRWVTWGAVFAAAAWLLASMLFSWYLTNLADYNATYGSLGAVIGFMLWTWISVMILLLGAELNAELEHQTARDSTTGPELPMGVRGATMADTLGASRKSRAAQAEAERAAAEPLRFPDAERPQGSRPARKHRSTYDLAVGFALPVAALGLSLALEIMDRRRTGRVAHQMGRHRPGAPKPAGRARSAGDRASGGLSSFSSLWARGRSVLADPALRVQLLHASRTALEYAARTAAAAGQRPKKRGWF